MMDFKCGVTAANLALLTNLLKDQRFGRGCLLESGRSYHYYGFQLLPEDLWRTFLGTCLLMTGFADDRYIGHQLVDGYCVLRLSPGDLRTKLPHVIVELP